MYNLENIKKNGFELKSENKAFDTPNRIYVMSGEMPSIMMMAIGYGLCRKNTDHRNDGNYVLIKMSTVKIPKECQFYGDSNMEGAYYTDKTVPADVIVSFEKHNLKLFNK